MISAIFLWREIAESCWTQSEQVKNGPSERGCRWFQLFFIDFQLFNFLTKIIPEGRFFGIKCIWGLNLTKFALVSTDYI